MLETLVVTYQLALLNAGKLTLECKLTEADTAQAELAVHRVRTAAALAARVLTSRNFCLRLHLTIIDVLATYILLT